MSKLVRRRASRRDRRGMTLVVALALMAIAMALSYAVMRTQGTDVQIQANSNLRERAKHAAWSGFASGLRNMHQSNWGGVNSTLAGSVNATDSFSVSYATGDPTLTPASAQYADYPYRVTLSVTGTATNPSHPGVVATHALRAVVRLAPKQLASEPASWPAMQQYTYFQPSGGKFTIDWPCRIQGDLYLQGPLTICPTYPYPSAAVTKYLGDLAAMSGAGTEYRPLSGTVHLPFTNDNNGAFRNWLSSTLGVATVDDKHDPLVSGWNYPHSMKSYQIYPGGAVYQAQTLGNQLRNATLAPDPLVNPLGLYYANGDLSLENHVSITGTLVCDGDISIDGTGVALQSYGLPALAGSTQPVHLPAAIAGGNFQVSAAPLGSVMQASVHGLIAAFGDFVIASDFQNAQFNLLGRVISSDFVIMPRREWQFSLDPFLNALTWQLLWNSYNSQSNGSGFGFGSGNTVPSQPYPLWLSQLGLKYTPSLTFAPDPTPLNYHWKKLSDSIYVPASGDPGMRWDVVSLVDNP